MVVTDNLEKGTAVIISGLQSEKGKKLNGGLGIILNHPIKENGVASRYPVLIYSLPKEDGTGHELMENTLRNKIRLENLEFDVDSESRQFKARAAKHFYLQDGNDAKANLFWSSFAFHQCPEDYFMGIHYATELVEIGRVQEGCDIISQKYADNDLVKASEHWGSFCFKFSLTYCAADKYEEALDFALKIPQDEVTQGHNLAELALHRLLNACNQNSRDVATNSQPHPVIAPMYLRVAKITEQRYPENVDSLLHLAAAYCLQDNNWEGARCYRRAIGSGTLDPMKARSATDSLVLAQSQCPGMPLHDYLILSCANGTANCVKKEDADGIKMSLDPGGLIKVESKDGRKVSVAQVSLPSDPDDPAFFPAAFLEELTEA